jgi:integrase
MQINEAIHTYLGQIKTSGLREYTALDSNFRTYCEANGVLRADQITTSIIAGYRRARAAEANWRTVNREMETIGHFCTMAAQWGLVSDRVALTAKPLDGPVFDYAEGLSREQVQALMWAMRKQPAWAYRMIQTTLLSGAKLNELISMEWAQVRFQEKLLMLAPPAKIRQFRNVLIGSKLVEALAEWQELGRDHDCNGPWVFGLKPREPEECRVILAKAMKDISLRGNWATLRHTHAYALFSAGLSDDEVAERMHMKVSMVREVYGRPGALEQIDLVEQLII